MKHIQTMKGTASGFYIIMLFTGIVLVSFNLRPAITSVGPVVDLIQKDLQLSHTAVGMLTSLPLLAFAAVSPLVPRLARMFTNGGSLIIGLFLIFAGTLLRSIFPSVVILFGGTLLIGIGIAICNVLIPVIVKDQFPDKVGIMTSVYSTAMGVLAALASGVSVPLARMGYGWEGALGIWAIPAAIGVFVWLYLQKHDKGNGVEPTRSPKGQSQVWKSPLAWQVALFFGFQSFLFYVTISWLPEILVSRGASAEEAGWLLSFLQIIGLPGSFIVPVLAARFRNQQALALILGLLSAFGYALLFFSVSKVWIIISMIAIGFPLSGSFALGLSFLAMRARDAEQSSELSGMAQSFGYLVSAVGPIFIGSLYDFSHTWDIPIFTLVATAILVAFFGMGAGRNKYI